jgi:hypothetical protein
MKFRLVSLGLALAVLSGCASTPAETSVTTGSTNPPPSNRERQASKQIEMAATTSGAFLFGAVGSALLGRDEWCASNGAEVGDVARFPGYEPTWRMVVSVKQRNASNCLPSHAKDLVLTRVLTAEEVQKRGLN